MSYLIKSANANETFKQNIQSRRGRRRHIGRLGRLAVPISIGVDAAGGAAVGALAGAAKGAYDKHVKGDEKASISESAKKGAKIGGIAGSGLSVANWTRKPARKAFRQKMSKETGASSYINRIKKK